MLRASSLHLLKDTGKSVRLLWLGYDIVSRHDGARCGVVCPRDVLVLLDQALHLRKKFSLWPPKCCITLPLGKYLSTLGVLGRDRALW